ncbi:MAG: DUF5602 domain-containing protein [Chitinophagaceae bacterium]
MKLLLSKFPETKKIISSFALFSMLLIMVGLTSCDKDPIKFPDQIFRGPEVTMGNGKANTFFKISGSGTPLEIGFEMTVEALTGLNQDPATPALSTFVLPLDQKAIDVTPFEHLVINWQPAGHLPVGLFNVPHFDFHLYTITLADRLAIPPYSPATAAKIDLLPPTGFMPVSYEADPMGIPFMGKHWVDPADRVTFSHNMIYGSYNGQVNFIEPMVTLAVLQAGNTITKPYAQPEKFAKTGKWYPTKYNIYLDSQPKKHYVSLSDFVKR